ncbi:winged helix-turn-helix domain-containing protein [Halolamina litorea]|uniref:ArsR/SmtB family transcription factor n=1 Tax=Halolamina litorea TaxID=1515593 RepID=A0ABD6BUP3_9EURY|nr:winged helix-turn-helix domain-containing protein [Halolamina litorea]
MGRGQSEEKLLDTLGDGRARRILAEVAQRPASVKELTERLDFSRATIYRRIEELRGHGLVDERTFVADDGNHYSEYRSDFGGTVVSLEDEEYDVRVFQSDEGAPEPLERR